MKAGGDPEQAPPAKSNTERKCLSMSDSTNSTTPPRHPMQPIVQVEGVTRFKQNKLVDTLLDEATKRGYSLNDLVHVDAPREDWEQFYQLIGYSLSGYGSLARVSETSHDAAQEMAENPSIDERDARIAALEETWRLVREGMRQGASVLFQRHPDDFLVAEDTQ